MKCRACGFENPTSSRYCNACGSKFDLISRALSAEERRRIYEEETVRDKARRDIRLARLLKLLAAIVLVSAGTLLLYRVTRPDPVEEIKREYAVSSSIIEDVKTVIRDAPVLFGASDEK